MSTSSAPSAEFRLLSKWCHNIVAQADSQGDDRFDADLKWRSRKLTTNRISVVGRVIAGHPSTLEPGLFMALENPRGYSTQARRASEGKSFPTTRLRVGLVWSHE